VLQVYVALLKDMLLLLAQAHGQGVQFVLRAHVAMLSNQTEFALKKEGEHVAT
jgi:hypothetical protein